MSVTRTFFLKVKINDDGSFDSSLVVDEFDLQDYLRIQIERAIECPINRNAVREKYPELHDISDDDLTKNHRHELVTVFRESKGADWTREHIRPLCMRLKEKSLKAKEIASFNPDCIFLNLEKLCKKCPQCVIRKIIEGKGDEDKSEGK